MRWHASAVFQSYSLGTSKSYAIAFVTFSVEESIVCMGSSQDPTALPISRSQHPTALSVRRSQDPTALPMSRSQDPTALPMGRSQDPTALPYKQPSCSWTQEGGQSAACGKPACQQHLVLTSGNPTKYHHDGCVIPGAWNNTGLLKGQPDHVCNILGELF